MKERNEGIRIREGFSEALKQEQCRNKDPRTIALDLQYLLLQNEKKKFQVPNWLMSPLPLTASFLGSPSLVCLKEKRFCSVLLFLFELTRARFVKLESVGFISLNS